MQAPTPPEAPRPAVSSLPPRPGGGRPTAGVVLGVVALAVALVAVGLTFVPARSSSSSTTVTVWAVVGSNGSLARGSGVINSSRGGIGYYYVLFDRPLSGCSYSASIGNTAEGIITFVGSVAVSLLPMSVSVLNVTTYNSTGGLANSSFHVAAGCSGGTPGVEFTAVVQANGTFVSGSAGASSSPGGTGRYTVLFPQNVWDCAFIGGLGESTSGTPPPGFFGAAQRSTSVDGVWVQTFNATGVAADIAFHLTVYC
jgi:hypothetical protein